MEAPPSQGTSRMLIESSLKTQAPITLPGEFQGQLSTPAMVCLSAWSTPNATACLLATWLARLINRFARKRLPTTTDAKLSWLQPCQPDHAPL